MSRAACVWMARPALEPGHHDFESRAEPEVLGALAERQFRSARAPSVTLGPGQTPATDDEHTPRSRPSIPASAEAQQERSDPPRVAFPARPPLSLSMQLGSAGGDRPYPRRATPSCTQASVAEFRRETLAPDEQQASRRAPPHARFAREAAI